jgi:hypothetical protein
MNTPQIPAPDTLTLGDEIPSQELTSAARAPAVTAASLGRRRKPRRRCRRRETDVSFAGDGVRHARRNSSPGCWFYLPDLAIAAFRPESQAASAQNTGDCNEQASATF